MLAKTPTLAAVPPVVKHRTITLTNRAPVRIVEDKWPIVAEGSCGYDCPGGPEGWDISIRVRHEKPERRIGSGRYLIHAKYSSFSDSGDDDCNQVVRVGRLLTAHEAADDLWKHILEVGEELRSRIALEGLRKHVTYAVDGCFAKLPAHDML